MEGVDLSNTIISNTNLGGAYLSNSTLANAQIDKQSLFTRTNLENVDLTGVNLRGLNFAFAVMNKDDFSNQDVSNTNFSFAQLRESNFTGASVTGADFKNANLTGITWTDGITKAVEKVVFASNKSGHNDIYIMDQDGTNELKLINNTNSRFNPILSPDKKKVLYAEIDPVSNYEDIYTVNIDGSNPVKLTNTTTDSYDAVFSSDGSKIIYTSEVNNWGDIWIMNVDGSGKVDLTPDQGNISDREASVFGNKIVFRSTRGGWTQVYLMDFTGKDPDDPTKGPRNLSNNKQWERKPIFSPDGTKILYKSDGNVNPAYPNNDAMYTIWVMNADGSNKRGIYSPTKDGFYNYDLIDRTVNGLVEYQNAENYYWTADNKIIMGSTYSNQKGQYFIGYGNVDINYNYHAIGRNFRTIGVLPNLYIDSMGILQTSTYLLFNDPSNQSVLKVYNSVRDEILELNYLSGNY